MRMLFSPFERMVAYRYLRARRQEGFVSVIATFSLLGIMLGVATLIIVMSVMNGFRADLLGRILGLNGHIGVYAGAGDGALKGFDAAAGQIRSLPGVSIVTPVVEGQAMATYQGRATGVIVRGMRPEDMANRPVLADNIVFGRLQDFQGRDTIMLGARLALRLGVHVGDRINLLSPKGRVTAFGSVPRVRSYRVAALFDIGMYEYDNGFAFLPLQAAQTYFQTADGVTQLEVVLDDADDLNAVVQATRERLAGQPVRLVDWQQNNETFFNALQVERNVMFLILTLIILVAAFNIISGMVMLVKDKGRDIAILRTMGAGKGAVMRIFFLTGASIGIVGTGLGVVLGVVFCLNIDEIKVFIEGLSGAELFSAEIYFLSRLPARMDVGEVITVCVMSLALTFFATLYPSWRASKLDPVEALRYE